jgi:hypothetical protein
MKFKNIAAFTCLILLLQAGFAGAQNNEPAKADTAQPKKMAPKPYKEVIKANAITQRGLLTVHKVDDRYYFEIPDSLYGREILMTNWLGQTPGGAAKYAGELANQNGFYFEKSPNGSIYLRLASVVNVADSVDMIFKALRDAQVDPILYAFDIKTVAPQTNYAIIDLTDFFLKDNLLTGINALKPSLTIGAQQADKSFIESMRVFPINMEITMTKTYTANASVKTPPGYPTIQPLEAAKQAGLATLQVRTSLMLLPKVPMQQRVHDTRVGYFGGAYWKYSDAQQRVADNYFIVRYRLEPKDEDLEKYKRGELVEPKKPIVYYTDPATPKQWRPFIIAGINDWQKAFEKAGFKNAIIGKEWPENDSTMSTEDARYAIVRYFPSETQNAYGPNINDPRSGEILQSYVGWYHNIMKLLHDWYMVQTAVVDPRARTMEFPDSLMGELIRFASSHEIGHTLGLRHNMGSSSTTPVEKLRDKKWVEANGHTPSIMDYARFNYVAQPEDSIGMAGIFPRIGAYDEWAIKWGYQYNAGLSYEEDKKKMQKMAVDTLNKNPLLWFGGEGRNNDPRAQTEDLGDNSMKASGYGIKNLKRAMLQLPEWTKSEDNSFYQNLFDIYRALVNQYLRYMLHVQRNVGGIYSTTKSAEQPGASYAPSPKEKQKEAIAFLNKELFTTQEWLMPKIILDQVHNGDREQGFSQAQKRVLGSLLNEQTLYTLTLCSERFGTANTYTLEEMMGDLKAGIWAELKTHKPIDIFRRDLQKEYVMQILTVMHEAIHPVKAGAAILGGATLEEMFPYLPSTDIPSYLSAELKQLRMEVKAALPATTDKNSKIHLQYIITAIDKGLEKRFDKEKTSLFGQ